MKKKLTMLVSMVAVIAICFSSTVSASNYDVLKVNSNELGATCISVQKFKPIEDQEDLFNMALEQSIMPVRRVSSVQSTELNNNLLKATQLLEVRTYDDGSTEKDYSSISFLPLKAGTFPVDVIKYKDFMNGGYGVAITCEANFTARLNELMPAQFQVRLNSVTTTVQNTGTEISAARGTVSCRVHGTSNSRNFTCQ